MTFIKINSRILKILGRKIMRETATAKKAAISTALAAISLIVPAFGLNSGEYRSTSFSIAVFIASVIQTTAIARIIQSHSLLTRLKIKPAIVIRTDARR